ncbi:MAG: hypothetical protein A2504_09490 [Bdellovibrionales bacterium RIFOXYD12_FULL_39_22]|nr:MAG: hypothetical protein A2385_12980 [Bdellovibrionales bacterium RIFOXYB1_FULL_39_21]OFZ40959.1 MAG: hypothetical protein A2485_16490 [Bdellovibrionales bacterium RIFOXYC12_FULL_39_17]OFZ44787.1 MAG: hypothetical protein A2404_09780 [Bdellovibrionales bacterium RIFOXYC1_FULL_39_130]OFZ73598.1 MAG: hypothetical protein A2451_06480 [Bdellovibrionales bacterium RIFOXYC2_FULL_39_8]OFZ74252.1 MAG: hypothetical protein A2560_16745 [Bdellovibrionales bacterium RIFOXYD1_FULL_39_84]OFZ92116.1 MAG:
MTSEKINYTVVKKWPTQEIVDLYSSAGWWKESSAARDAIPQIITGSFCFMVATIYDSQKHCEHAIGMGRTLSDGVSDAYIQDLVVLKEYRKFGIGKILTEKLTNYCQERGIVWIGLIAEPNTSSFYEKIGYKVIPQFIPMRFPTRELP